MTVNNISYNKHFDETKNKAINELLKRSPKGHPPRVNRKNEESAFDEHFAFILEKISEGKSQGQVLNLLQNKYGLVNKKSSLSRFLKKKREIQNA